MINKILIKINKVSLNELVKLCFTNNIEIYTIKENKDYIILEIDKNNLKEISKLYKVEILKDNTLKNIYLKLKKKLFNVILLIISFIMFIFLSNIIVKVNILSNNLELVKNLNISLEKQGIKRLSLKKNFIELEDIKNNILNEYKDKLEWLEIEQIGMTYNIKLEERKKENKSINKERCHVIANTDGVITKVIADIGEVLVKKNQVVKEGETLISGQINLYEETKADVCANGLVFAEKWYNVSIEIPKKYTKKEYTNKKRYNIEIEVDNRDFKIFKSRLNKYDTDKDEIISLLGKKIYLLKEYEYVDKEYEYDENSLDKRINELVEEKLELNLLENERILTKNILKKDENNSKIKIELFVSIEKLISKQVEY